MDINEIEGLLSLSQAQKDEARNFGLLQAGLGILARNTDRRNPMPAIGGGMMQGLQGYQGQMERAEAQNLKKIMSAQAIEKLREAQNRKKIIQEYGAQITDPAERQRFMVDPDGYIKEQSETKGFAPGSDIYRGGKKIGSVAKEGKGTWSDPYTLGGATVQKNSETGEIRTAVTRAPSASVNVPSQPVQYWDDAQKKYVWGTIVEAKGKPAPAYDVGTRAALAAADTGAKSGVEMNDTEFQTASSAYKALPQMQKLQTLIESGHYNAGTAAQLRQGFDKALALLGGKDAAVKASNTELVNALTGAGVFPLIQSLGIGARGLDTPAEKQFLLDVMVGSVGMEPGALLELTKDRVGMMRQSVESFNKRVEAGELDDWFKTKGRAKKTFDLGGNEKAMKTLPPAQQHKGKTIRDTKTGALLRSNGMSWVSVGG